MNAYLAAFRRAFDFKGRSTRSEFWLFVLFGTLAVIVASLIDTLILHETGTTWLATLVSLVQFIPSISVGVRRLHDTGRSGWWYLVGLVPLVGWIVLIVFLCGRTRPRPGLMHRVGQQCVGRVGVADGIDPVGPSAAAGAGLGILAAETVDVAGAAASLVTGSGDTDDDADNDADNDADMDFDMD
jgi:uncharacterized membrane protein YhaH (DUF805 family)